MVALAITVFLFGVGIYADWYLTRYRDSDESHVTILSLQAIITFIQRLFLVNT